MALYEEYSQFADQGLLTMPPDMTEDIPLWFMNETLSRPEINHWTVLMSGMGGNAIIPPQLYDILRLPYYEGKKVAALATGELYSSHVTAFAAFEWRYVTPNTVFYVHGHNFTPPDSEKIDLYATQRLLSMVTDSITRSVKILNEACNEIPKEFNFWETIMSGAGVPQLINNEKILEWGLALPVNAYKDLQSQSPHAVTKQNSKIVIQ